MQPSLSIQAVSLHQMAESKIFAIVSVEAIMFGWWPVKLVRNNRHRTLYKPYKQLLNTITYCFLLSLSLGLAITVLNDAEMKEIFDNASLLLGLTVATVRAWTTNSKKAENVIEEVICFETELFGPLLNKTRECLYNRWVKFLNVVTVSLAVLGITITLLYLVFPIISSQYAASESKQLPFKLWLPFDSQKHYTVAYILNVIGSVITVGTALNGDCTTVLFILHGIQRAEILYDIIKNFRSGIIKQDYEDLEMTTRKAVRELVKKHQAFIK